MHESPLSSGRNFFDRKNFAPIKTVAAARKESLTSDNLALIRDIVKNLIQINVDSTKKEEKRCVKRRKFVPKIAPSKPIHSEVKPKLAEVNENFNLVNKGSFYQNDPINVHRRPCKVFLSASTGEFPLVNEKFAYDHAQGSFAPKIAQSAFGRYSTRSVRKVPKSVADFRSPRQLGTWLVTLRPIAVVASTGRRQRSISVFSSYQIQLKSAKNEHPAQASVGFLKISIRKKRFVPKWRRGRSYDEEEGGEAEDEVEVEDAPKEEEKPKAKPPQPRKEEEETGKEMTEAEKALKAQKKKHEADDAEKLREYEEQRRIQREREEEELRMLKEKQERRRQEREEEERMMMQKRRDEEDKRRAEDEARKQKAEDEKRRKEEEKRKKQAMMAGLQASNGPNFELPKRDANQEKFDKFGNIMKAKAEMGLTKQQHEEQKKRALQDVLKSLNCDGLDVAALKTKVKELHQRICKLEAVKYDLEQRQVRQDYDLKELNERQRQISRNKALKKGLDPEEAATSRHPPKVPTASKYDRQIDRRSYGDRRTMFESPKKSKEKGIFHGSARPPDEWGRRVQNEELENIRKNLGPVKYVENVKADGARPPMEPIPVQIPPEEREEE